MDDFKQPYMMFLSSENTDSFITCKCVILLFNILYREL